MLLFPEPEFKVATRAIGFFSLLWNKIIHLWKQVHVVHLGKGNTLLPFICGPLLN